MTAADGPVTIRPAVPRDALAISRLVDGLRASLGNPTGNLSEARIITDGFGAKPEFRIIVADTGTDLVGYALFLDAYEPAYAAKGVYMADLFVAASARRGGIGRRLVDAVGADAQARGRSFVWWVTSAKNTEGQAFYRRLNLLATEAVVAHVILMSP